MGEEGISNKNYFCDIFSFESAKKKIGQEEDHKVKGNICSFKDRNGLNIDWKMGARDRITNCPGLPGRVIFFWCFFF